MKPRTFILLAGIALLAAPRAHAERATALLWSFQGNGNLQAIAACPDIDGDGGPDIVFEGYENGPSGVDHVFAIRGNSSGTGQVLWSARPIGGASSGGGYGDNCLRLGPDLNGDGFPEMLLGSAWGGRTAYALNGLTGATVWGFDTYAYYGTNSGWIYAMDSLGSDLTGDGVPEIVFGSGSYNDRVHCVNGATGALVWAYPGGDAFFDVLSCQDINNDGVRDVVAALGDNSPVSPRVIALSGANGSVIWQRQVSGTIWNLVFVSDINGDGVRDISMAQWGSVVQILSGKTGSILASVASAQQQRVASLDDVNGDGKQDLVFGYNTTPGVKVLNGATGATIWSAATSDWCWAVDRIADCTGDGINDVVAGDFDGWVYLFNGVTGSLEWSWLNPTGDKIKTIRGVPDLNGNGIPDVVAGTQLLYSPPTGGYVYALEGNTAPVTVRSPELVAGWRLGEAQPNPTAGGARWSLSADRPGTARLALFAPDGRLVRDLGERALAAGQTEALSWDGLDADGRKLPAGVYHARLWRGGVPVGASRVVVLR
jgi:hypothetical protein